MVGIEPIRLPRRHDAPGRHESGQLVDVTVGVVPRQFASQPDHPVDGELCAQHLLQVIVG